MLKHVTIEGMTGLDDEADRTAFAAAIGRWAEAHPGEQHAPEGMRLIALNDTLRRYNTLRPLLAREQEARAGRDRALRTVETCWDALRSPETVAWFAAHHRYVEAVAEARTAIDTWEKAAAAAQTVPFVWEPGSRQAAYERILAGGHPPVEPLTGDPAAIAEALRTNLDQVNADRETRAAKTLALPHVAAL
ncbi:hypothetical protein [Streptomyces sp. NPDC001404]|uniref:hypothetical protein n=1 Tax=Streptomyces sp. NPDC001404 TaxID=3364571 RepID=UPI00367573F0